MKQMTLDQIKTEIDRMANRLGASGVKTLPTYGYSEQSGRPHIEVDECGYHFVVSERGYESERLTTQEVDELLYYVFESVTHQLATKYELQHRVEDQDFRRLLFKRQIELLSILSPKWAMSRSKKIEEILRQYPFDDSSSARMMLFKELRAQGHSSEDASRVAEEKYQMPARASESGKS
jgi:hypothetical protein